jgi:TnpA family transposase
MREPPVKTHSFKPQKSLMADYKKEAAMPRRFLSQPERERLSQFPLDIPESDLVVYFTLTPEDKKTAQRQYRTHNQLGFALLLCTLRYLGFFPTEMSDVPERVIVYVADQLEVLPDTLDTYLNRPENRLEQLGPVMAHLGFRRFERQDKEPFVTWLGKRALEDDRQSGLLQLACERLYQMRLVRPAVTTMEELVAGARRWAQEKTAQILVEPLPPGERDRLTVLLTPMEEKEITPLTWLRRSATGHSDKDILDTLAKLIFIRQWSLETWDIAELPPSRLKLLARIARYTSPNGLQRRKPVGKRDAILTAFLLWAYEKTIDELIDLFDLCLAKALRKSRRELKEHLLSQVTRMQKVVGYFQGMTEVLLDEKVSDTAIRPSIYQQITPEILQDTLEETRQILVPGGGLTHLDFFDHRYSYFRRFAPAFLEALTFHHHADDDGLLDAIDVLRDLNEKEDKPSQVLENVSTAFVPAAWESRVLNEDGTISRRNYEMCALSELRDALRSGVLWVEGSRRYASLDSYLIPKDRWPQMRITYCEMVGVPEDAQVQIAEKQADLEKRLAHFDRHLPNYTHVRLENGRLILSPLEKEEAEIRELPLTSAVGALLPSVQSAEVLVEVDSWTHFSDQFTHAGDTTSRMSDLPRHLYAIILAQACNIELWRMAELADLSYDRLIWCANWYIREETLQEATNVLVNFQYQQALSHHWGDGTFSSSDGQRFAVARKTNKATPLPRYFGYGRGLSFLTWTSDQLSQYGTRVTPPTVREATFVLDAILNNETDLNIQEHTTDTAGYTDLVFALFDLLGLQFSPRLRDIGGHNLYCIDKSIKYEHIGPLITRPIDVKLIEESWDDFLRTAASLKMGWVTASTLISKLQALPHQHKLTRALQEYGRLVRTIFILRYLSDEKYRRRILVQLNKGEQMHGLRGFLFFDNQGRIRKRQPEGLVNQAGCLNLLSNAIVVWNTVYMQAALNELQKQGQPVNEADFVHLSPARYAHINPYGKFRFELGANLTSDGLRPLRSGR